jgi:hypothetical protein
MAWWKMSVPKQDGGMGFRDLHNFNQAMLAKQCWRLLSDPDSLCAQVLRAKYYPDGDMLKAVLKKGSPFTWQSIMSGLKTFKRGCIWRVGDGSTINIWADQRVPSSPNHQAMTPRGAFLLSTVQDLINPITESWDEELLRENFWSIDVERVLRIPLPSHGQPGFIAWLLNKSGCFTVKSAYHEEWRAMYSRRLERGDGTNRASPHVVWQRIWNAKVPRKVQIFNWRALHGIVPCHCTLANKHMNTAVKCPVCNVDPEDLTHATSL